MCCFFPFGYFEFIFLTLTKNYNTEMSVFRSFFFALTNRQKLDSKNVSLENVIIKEAESLLVGTIKVKNLSFNKEVFVRSTWDNWKTQQDTICTYTPVSSEVS